MNLEKIQNNLKNALKEKRYLHSVGVEEVACDMAVIFGYDMKKAAIAGLLHDCAKHLSDEQLLIMCDNYHIAVSDIEKKSPYLLHGKVGAVYAKEIYGIHDKDILSSIIYHTTGRPAMSLLEKIIFTADYIEPNRKPLPRIDEIRAAAYSDLDLAVALVLENVLNYLKSESSDIDAMTEQAYNYYQVILETRMKERGL